MKPKEPRAAEEENKARTLVRQTSPSRHEEDQQEAPIFRTDHGAMSRWRAKTHSGQEHSEASWSVLHRLQNANTHHWPFSCSAMSDGAPGTKRSAQDKTKAAEVKKEVEVPTKVTKTQRADGRQKSEAQGHT